MRRTDRKIEGGNQIQIEKEEIRERQRDRTQDVGVRSSMAGTRVSSRTICKVYVNKDKSNGYYDVYTLLQI